MKTMFENLVGKYGLKNATKMMKAAELDIPDEVIAEVLSAEKEKEHKKETSKKREIDINSVLRDVALGRMSENDIMSYVGSQNLTMEYLNKLYDVVHTELTKRYLYVEMYKKANKSKQFDDCCAVMKLFRKNQNDIGYRLENNLLDYMRPAADSVKQWITIYDLSLAREEKEYALLKLNSFNKGQDLIVLYRFYESNELKEKMEETASKLLSERPLDDLLDTYMAFGNSVHYYLGVLRSRRIDLKRVYLGRILMSGDVSAIRKIIMKIPSGTNERLVAEKIITKDLTVFDDWLNLANDFPRGNIRKLAIETLSNLAKTDEEKRRVQCLIEESASQ